MSYCEPCYDHGHDECVCGAGDMRERLEKAELIVEVSDRRIRKLLKRLRERKARVKELEGLIRNFCEGQEWATMGWKDQPHIKPLFDEVKPE